MESDLKPKERFTGLAEDYAKARPGYSDEAIDFVLKHCALKSGDLVVDIGCGTGIASRAFASRGLRIIGIEPNEDMRKQAQLANEELSKSDSKLPIYQDGSAEHTGLSDNYTDAVVSAQAFHWFDKEKSLVEFARILKPHGWVILIWNLRDESNSTTKGYCELIRKYGNAERAIMSVEANMEKSGNKLLESHLFDRKQKFVFANEQELDEEGLIKRAFSVSYAPIESNKKEMLINGLRQLFRQHQENGLITMNYNLELYVGCRP